MAPYRIFISRVSGEFGRLSEELAADLRAKGMARKIQIDFRQEAETATTLDKLEKYVREADAVIALIGERSGSYPPEAAAAKWPGVLPAEFPRATYTQWEVHFARKYGKRLSFYFSQGYAPEKPASPDDDAAGQQTYARWLTKTLGLDRDPFANADQLCRAVLKEPWPEFPRSQPRNLLFPTLGALFLGREDFLQTIRRELQAAQASWRVACVRSTDRFSDSLRRPFVIGGRRPFYWRRG